MKMQSNIRFFPPLSNFHISRFPFPLVTILSLIVLVFAACSSSTESSKGSLSGAISLEGQEDQSGISVAVYTLAYLDTTIVRINKQYPHIGVIINQHTEFDHRLQAALYQTTTNADGSFSLKDIPTGKYNFVARKDGFGFRYITDLEISKGENHLSDQGKREKGKGKIKKDVTLRDSKNFRNSIEGQTSSHISHLPSHDAKYHSPSEPSGSSDFSHFTSPISQIELDDSILNSTLNRSSDLSLFPETTFSGNLSGEHIFKTNHHYIIEDHTSFVPGSSLEIQPGAVVRINPGKDLLIYGTIKAQGEIDNMFWVTSNDGFIAEGKREKGKGKSSSISPFPSHDAKYHSPSEPSASSDFSLFTSPISHRSDEIALYNSMHIYPTAAIVDDLIEWGKWDWGNFALQLEGNNNLQIENSKFQGKSSGLYTQNSSESKVKKILTEQSTNVSYGGLYLLYSYNCDIQYNLVLNSAVGIQIYGSTATKITDNYIAYCGEGIVNLIYSTVTKIEYNDFQEHGSAIVNIGDSSVYVFFNNITAEIGVNNSILPSHGSNAHSYINNNNLICSIYAVRARSILYQEPRILDAKNNWWNTANISEIVNFIWDKHNIDSSDIYYQYYGIFEYTPFRTQKVQNAGIRQ